MKEKENITASVSNIFKLDGRVPVSKAIPFGVQHVLACLWLILPRSLSWPMSLGSVLSLIHI